MNKPLKIIFAGTPEFSVSALQALLESEHDVVGVYTQPDRPAGRGRKLTASPVKAVALEAGIDVYQPENFKTEETISILKALDADLMIVVAYGLLLPVAVLDAPRLGCINIHASILPRWRGAAPIQRSIAAGDKETGVAIMQMEKGLDTGPVYLLDTTPIAFDETGGSLHDRLAIMGAETLMKALPGIADGSAVAQVQDAALMTYAKKLNKSESQIDWNKTAVELSQQIRAFNPWPVSFTAFEKAGKEVKLRIWNADVIEGNHHQAGTVVAVSKVGIDVATGAGLLRITQLQMPGKKALAVRDFINSNDIAGVQFNVS